MIRERRPVLEMEHEPRREQDYPRKVRSSSIDATGAYAREPYARSPYARGKRGSRFTYSIYNAKSKSFKLLMQIAVSALIFAAVFSLNRMSFPLAGWAKDGVRYLLTTETNFAPVLSKAWALVRRWDGIPLPALEQVQTTGAKPVISEVPDEIIPVLPVTGKVVVPYGWVYNDKKRFFEFHSGLDLEVKNGAPIKAVVAGTVTRIYTDEQGRDCIIISHGENLMTQYVGMGEMVIAEGKRVAAEQELGVAPAAGADGAVRVHFEVLKYGKPIDPLSVIGSY